VVGAQTSIDGNVLNQLVEPLMHLLRNSIDHGVEAAELRAAAGKPADGRIELTFSRDGASILVRVADDGRGLDIVAIRRRAAEHGLIAANAAMADDEVARLVLLPGFSTRAEATQVSGRGIGMDAVNAAVLTLNGSLRLHNAPGRGLTVELRLPASLMTTHGLLVRHENRVVAISSYGVQDIRYVTNDLLEVIGESVVYRDGDRIYSLEPLDRLIGGSAPTGPDQRGWFPALIVQTESGALRAVRVQEVLDSQDLVVKDFGRYVARPVGVAGVTVLGDGSIAPVLDLPQLLRAPVGTLRPLPRRSVEHSRVEARRLALVVDDSLSARRAAAQLMSDAGFEVRTAIDGLEAASMIEKRVPDVVLVDMEMPRMNGLEFTAHLRTRDATCNVPVIMITSRSTDKHRRQAEAAGVDVYLTKPFSGEQLLEQVERLTRPRGRSRAAAATVFE
jgi:chemosensory pili system protein ChpA (sensor histidine kinase/response regulator)